MLLLNGQGVPWAPQSQRRYVQIDDLIAINLAGGTHHAHRDFGSGFCVFNDVAVATRHLQAEGVSRIAILDLDVHQGDGTATLFQDDPAVLTISLHCERKFPISKSPRVIMIADWLSAR